MAPTEPIPNDPGPVPPEPIDRDAATTAQAGASAYAKYGITRGAIIALESVDALGYVSPFEFRSMIDYLCGYAPSAVLHATAMIDKRRADIAEAAAKAAAK